MGRILSYRRGQSSRSRSELESAAMQSGCFIHRSNLQPQIRLPSTPHTPHYLFHLGDHRLRKIH